MRRRFMSGSNCSSCAIAAAAGAGATAVGAAEFDLVDAAGDDAAAIETEGEDEAVTSKLELLL